MTCTIVVCHCCHHLPLLRGTFYAANVINFCHRLLLLPSSSIRVTSTIVTDAITYHYFVRLSMLPTFSTLSSPSSAVVVYNSSDFCYHRLSLLPSSNTASCDFLCCQRVPLLSSSSSAAVVFYSCDFYHCH
ncbi:hypothetical protein CDAR_510081 [Caerostris darwini]|uniref:Uncharacterized protein n=1 Tax=Caerostris darwini TaxID=1538125 RepID=A0AAV4X4T6_9ARAC|nr:hypothetical protein CDAR_510081 [Caerostris darwini]